VAGQLPTATADRQALRQHNLIVELRNPLRLIAQLHANLRAGSSRTGPHT
jgi:hypothetical protein